VNVDPPDAISDPHHKAIHWLGKLSTTEISAKVFSEMLWGKNNLIFLSQSMERSMGRKLCFSSEAVLFGIQVFARVWYSYILHELPK